MVIRETKNGEKTSDIPEYLIRLRIGKQASQGLLRTYLSRIDTI